MKKNILFIYLVLQSITLHGQLQQIIHQTFTVDEMNQINLDIFGKYSVEIWPGSEVLTETTVKLTNASHSILTYLIENKRYAIQLDTLEERSVALVSIDKKRLGIKTSKGESKEEIAIRIFVPDFFEKKNEQLWTRINPIQRAKD